MKNQEEERTERDEIAQQFSADDIQTATEAAVRYEVELSYKNVPWKKGLVLLEELRKLGYTIQKL